MNIEDLCYKVIGAAMAMNASHEDQLVNYLNATGIDDGPLVNFGAESLQHKHKYRIYRPAESLNPVNPVNPV